MSTSQVLILIFCSIVIVLAIWNLVLALQNMYLENYLKRTEIKKEEEKRKYYGWFK